MAGRSAVYAPHGVVAAPQPLASQAGSRVLQQGGNAVDAAVTAAIMLGLVEPMMSGIGGDLFVIMWSAKEQKLIGLNASGRAGSLLDPRGAAAPRPRSHAGHRRRDHHRSGALSGWAALLERYGTISLAAALEPAIQLAEDGFPVTPGHREGMGRPGPGAASRLGRARHVLRQHGQGPGRRASGSPTPDCAATLPANRAGRPRRVLRRRARPADRRPGPRARRIPHHRGFPQPQRRMADADSAPSTRAIGSGSCRPMARASQRSRCCGSWSHSTCARWGTTRRPTCTT